MQRHDNDHRGWPKPDDGSATGPNFWRSLEELTGSEEFLARLQQEFPHAAERWDSPSNRREFLKLMGASLALAGFNGCTGQPVETIVPYAEMPEQLVPGKPMLYATATTLGGFAVGVLAESHMGRPTKIEGNPQHPASLGATDAFAQASVLGLYDPDRSQVVLQAGQLGTWQAFLGALNAEMAGLEATAGAGLRILTETVTSPTLGHQLQALLEKFPQARWHQYEPVNRANVQAGAVMAFGESVETVYDFSRADVILSLDADFLTVGPGRLRYAREFGERRQVGAGGTSGGVAQMSRLYVLESTPTLTGAAADHVLRLMPEQIDAAARFVGARLGVDVDPPSDDELNGIPSDWLDALVDDLNSDRLGEEGNGAAFVVAGLSQPPRVHAWAHAINDALGSVGKTVTYTEPVEARPVDQFADLQSLVAEMRAGAVQALVMLGGNPVFNAPVDLNFADALNHVPFRVHLSRYEDETSVRCQWHIPETHDLESWGDARAYDGTATIIQPLIAPLYGSKSAHEVLAVMLGEPGVSAHDIVKRYWSQRRGEADFDRYWRRALHDGFVRGTRAAARQVSLRETFGEAGAAESAAVKSESSATVDSKGEFSTDAGETDRFHLIFRPDPTIWDGRFANNGWLQELPKPLTKLTWDNAALISPATAERLNLSGGDVVILRGPEHEVRLPVWIVPGHADRSVTVHFGYGRTRVGRVGTGTGANVFALRRSDAFWWESGIEMIKTGRREELAATQNHHLMGGRDLVRAGTLQEFLADPSQPEFAAGEEHGHEGVSLYPEIPYEGYKWGMSVNLSACIGCNACVVACQAENNIPIVGKSGVARQREMHWLRIDHYYEGSASNPRTYHQPVPCMHCEHAPCEPVCPVAATTHSPEGVNEMTYNRCVGTRYCSNNCPYKVRRFNFFDYQATTRELPVLQLLQNPDVTVRSRGVMEKCTYCVQRINAARIEAEVEQRQIRDGEVVTACQSACPTQAIVFGDLNDSSSRVKQLKESPLDYSLLAELNTRPRTTYLAALYNPNPQISRE